MDKKIFFLYMFYMFFLIYFIHASSDTKKNEPYQEKVFSIEDLSKFDGKNGRSAYVAIDGIVYDVSAIGPWKNGEHKKNLKAGNDHSNMIVKSPHGKGVLKKLPKVVVLKK